MIEMGKQYQTRDGRAVRLLCVDSKITQRPVVGLIRYSDGTEVSCSWTADGYYHSTEEGQHLLNSCLDLIYVPERHEVWVIVDRRGQVIDSFDTGSRAEVEALCHWDEGHTVHRAIWES